MTLLKVFQVMVGLMLAYLLLSLITSAVQEILASISKARGRNLLMGLRTLLADGSTQGASISKLTALAFPHGASSGASLLYQKVSGHPLVGNLSPSRLASYVPPRNFALAVIDVLRSNTPQSLPLFAQIEHGMAALPDGPAKQCINVFLTDAVGDIELLKQNLAGWYNDAMDRTSGLYKRFSLYFALAFGVLLAVAFNVDSICIVSALWHNPATAASVVQAAQAQVAQAAAKQPTNQSPAATQPSANQPSLTQPLQDALNQLISSPLPIGWPAEDLTEPWFIRMIGWLITAIAVSVGAPFWFDALSAFLNIRGSGPAPLRPTGGSVSGSN